MRRSVLRSWVCWIAQSLIVPFLVFATMPAISPSFAQSPESVGCGGKKIEVADLQWPSATILAHVHAQLLASQLNCDVSIVVSDIESVTTTLKTTQRPTLIPEMWPTRVADRWNQTVEARAAFTGGPTYDVTQIEGWFVPAKVVQDFPALASIENLKDMSELYQSARKPKFVSCPKEWACAVINRNMLKSLGLFGAFDVIEPQNRIEMDQLIGQMSATNEPMVFYYWQPNALLAQLDVKPIAMGAYDAKAYACYGRQDCTNAAQSAYPIEVINLVVADWVRGDAPELIPYVRKAQMPIGIMNQLLAKMVDQNMSAEAVAADFLANHEEIWRIWLPVFDR